MPTPVWKMYQEETAAFFRNIDMDATTDEVLEGARGKHAVDVAVRTHRAGVSQLWIVECKRWNRPVSKDRVLVLAEIVTDTGADRGLLLSESGFQAGAIRAAHTRNITLTSLSDLRDNTVEEMAEIDAYVALKCLALLQDRVRLLGNPYLHASSTGQMRPGVEKSVTTAVVGRAFLATRGLQNALAGILPTLVDAEPGKEPTIATTLREAVNAAYPLVTWAHEELGHQEAVAREQRELPQRASDDSMVTGD